MLSRKLTTLLVSLPLLFASSLWAVPVKILPLGDSITSDGDFAYRDELYDKLTDAGYDFEFVGSCPSTTVASCNTTPSNNENYNGVILRHEGHSGWEANDIIGQLSTWVTNYDVDVALIHLGTNDIINRLPNAGVTGASVASNATQTQTELETIISTIKNKNANAAIFVAKILPLGSIKDTAGEYTPTPPDLTNDYSGPLNGLLTPAWAALQSITLVDQYTGFTTLNMRNLLIHPNASGELKMAERWYDALKTAAILPPVLTLSPSATSTTGSAVTISATTPSAGSITYSTDSIGICAVVLATATTATVTPQAVGNCKITATQAAAGADAYAATTTVITIQVTAVAQSIEFTTNPLPTTKVFGDADFTLTSKLFKTNAIVVPVLGVSITPTVCSMNGETVHIIIAGDCKIKASDLGGMYNGTIYAPVEKVHTISIAKAEQNIKITVAPPLNKTYGDAPFTLTAVSFNTKTPPVETGLTVSIGSSTQNVCTYDTTTKKVTIKSAGLCTIKTVQAGNDQYKSKTKTIDISISAKGQTINFPSIGNKVVNSAPFNISAIASSGLPVSFSSSTTNVCTVSNTTVILLAVGTCRITATAGNSNNTTANATQEFEVTKVLQTVAFAANTPTTKTTKDSPFTVSANSTSNLAVSITSTTNSICTIDTSNKVSIHAAGNCILEAKQAGDATYKAVTVTHTIIVSIANTTYDTVVKIINGNSNAAAINSQLSTLGLKDLKPNYDYTQALKRGPYKNKAKPTIAEMQLIINKENKGNLETAGSASIFWLSFLGFIVVYRRRLLKQSA